MTTLGSSVQTLGNLLHTHDLYDHLRAVPPAIAPYADPLNFCSPRIAACAAGDRPRGCRAEALGFDSVWVNHHILNVGYIRKRLGAGSTTMR